MRGSVVVVVVLLLVGCSSSSSTPADASAVPVDAATDARVVADANGPTIGSVCDSATTYYCAQYYGLCVSNVCRWLCTDLAPRCRPGEREQHVDLGRGMACYCAP